MNLSPRTSVPLSSAPAPAHTSKYPRAPQNDILRLTRSRQREQAAASFLEGFQAAQGTRGDDGLMWIVGYTWAELADRLTTRDGIPWSERSFSRAIAGLKKRGRVVVFKNKRHRGTARLRIVPKAASARILAARERYLVAASLTRAETGTIASESASADPPGHARPGGSATEVRPPILAVPVVTEPPQGLSELRPAHFSAEMSAIEQTDGTEAPPGQFRTPASMPATGGTSGEKPVLRDPPATGPTAGDPATFFASWRAKFERDADEQRRKRAADAKARQLDRGS